MTLNIERSVINELITSARFRQSTSIAAHNPQTSTDEFQK